MEIPRLLTVDTTNHHENVECTECTVLYCLEVKSPRPFPMPLHESCPQDQGQSQHFYSFLVNVRSCLRYLDIHDLVTRDVRRSVGSSRPQTPHSRSPWLYRMYSTNGMWLYGLYALGTNETPVQPIIHPINSIMLGSQLSAAVVEVLPSRFRGSLPIPRILFYVLSLTFWGSHCQCHN